MGLETQYRYPHAAGYILREVVPGEDIAWDFRDSSEKLVREFIQRPDGHFLPKQVVTRSGVDALIVVEGVDSVLSKTPRSEWDQVFQVAAQAVWGIAVEEQRAAIAHYVLHAKEIDASLTS